MGLDYPQLLIFSRPLCGKDNRKSCAEGQKTQIPQNTQTIKTKAIFNPGYLDSLCHSMNNNVINILKNTFFVLY